MGSCQNWIGNCRVIIEEISSVNKQHLSACLLNTINMKSHSSRWWVSITAPLTFALWDALTPSLWDVDSEACSPPRHTTYGDTLLRHALWDMIWIKMWNEYKTAAVASFRCVHIQSMLLIQCTVPGRPQAVCLLNLSPLRLSREESFYINIYSRCLYMSESG